jgi:hypothetical protein
MEYAREMSTSSFSKEDYFIPSPFCIPLPDDLEDDFMLPSSMIEELVSKRIRSHRPFYRIPSPPTHIPWKTDESVVHGQRILVYRLLVSSKTTFIVHDYIHVRDRDAVNGWIRKYVAYYHTEKSPYGYDINQCIKLESIEPIRSVFQPTMSILRSCSLLPPPAPCPQPVHPRSMKRVKKKPIQKEPFSLI